MEGFVGLNQVQGTAECKIKLYKNSLQNFVLQKFAEKTSKQFAVRNCRLIEYFTSTLTYIPTE